MRTSHGRVQAVFLCLLRQAEGAACVYLRGGGIRVLLRGKKVLNYCNQALARLQYTRGTNQSANIDSGAAGLLLWCEQ